MAPRRPLRQVRAKQVVATRCLLAAAGHVLLSARGSRPADEDVRVRSSFKSLGIGASSLPMLGKHPWSHRSQRISFFQPTTPLWSKRWLPMLSVRRLCKQSFRPTFARKHVAIYSRRTRDASVRADVRGDGRCGYCALDSCATRRCLFLPAASSA